MSRKSHPQPSRAHSAGFTLIELMITISIVAILLTIGVPSFRYVTSSNRASSEINGLLGDLQFARAESIRQGLPIIVCPSANSTLPAPTCLAGANQPWHTGWFVFADVDNSGTFNAGDILLRQQKSFSGTDTLFVDNNVPSVQFSRNGFALGLPGPSVFRLRDATNNQAYRRCLSATIVGGLSTSIGGGLTVEGPASC